MGVAPLVVLVVVVMGAPRAGSPPAGGFLRGSWGWFPYHGQRGISGFYLHGSASASRKEDVRGSRQMLKDMHDSFGISWLLPRSLAVFAC